jgi:hypothetical protein
VSHKIAVKSVALVATERDAKAEPRAHAATMSIRSPNSRG